MTIQWIEYPISIGDEDDEMTITWDDGSTDIVPANNGDGEAIFQLPRLMDEVFRVENFNCFPGQSGQFIDEYPTLFRSKTGAHVLRVNSEESFMNAFVCQSKNAAECLISWMSGDLANAMHRVGQQPEGMNDFHWVSVREVLGFIASGLLDDFPPTIFDLEENDAQAQNGISVEEFERVELPWWYPPSREGPVFGYPACLFLPETYSSAVTLERVDSPSVAISISQRLTESDWQELLNHLYQESLAQNIVLGRDGYKQSFMQIRSHSIQIGAIWLDRWSNLA